MSSREPGGARLFGVGEPGPAALEAVAAIARSVESPLVPDDLGRMHFLGRRHETSFQLDGGHVACRLTTAGPGAPLSVRELRVPYDGAVVLAAALAGSLGHDGRVGLRPDEDRLASMIADTDWEDPERIAGAGRTLGHLGLPVAHAGRPARIADALHPHALRHAFPALRRIGVAVGVEVLCGMGGASFAPTGPGLVSGATRFMGRLPETFVDLPEDALLLVLATYLGCDAAWAGREEDELEARRHAAVRSELIALRDRVLRERRDVMEAYVDLTALFEHRPWPPSVRTIAHANAIAVMAMRKGAALSTSAAADRRQVDPSRIRDACGRAPRPVGDEHELQLLHLVVRYRVVEEGRIAVGRAALRYRGSIYGWWFAFTAPALELIAWAASVLAQAGLGAQLRESLHGFLFRALEWPWRDPTEAGQLLRASVEGGSNRSG